MLVKPNSSVKKLLSLTVLSVNSLINAIATPINNPKTTPASANNFLLGDTGLVFTLALDTIVTLSTCIIFFTFLVKILPIVLATRSEEHTSELQSRFDLVCRLLLEKKKKNI